MVHIVLVDPVPEACATAAKTLDVLVERKVARGALGKKQYEAARDAASQVLDYEPDNYNAYIY